jgi:hypothetical protein
MLDMENIEISDVSNYSTEVITYFNQEVSRILDE